MPTAAASRVAVLLPWLMLLLLLLLPTAAEKDQERCPVEVAAAATPATGGAGAAGTTEQGSGARRSPPRLGGRPPRNTTAAFAAAPGSARPNIAFFLADDLGWADLSNESPAGFYESPFIDSIAAGGTKFTRGYSASRVCSPSRCAAGYFQKPFRNR
eukprot:SAG22_NODE_254_length_13588_cov_10.695678_9_plen_157_part_00